jgi:hypothetical protein
VTDAAALLRALAVPRLVGSEAHRAARELLTLELTTRGFTVEEQRFGATDGPLRRAAFAAELAGLAALAFIVGALAGEPVQGLRIALVPLIALLGVALFGGRGARHAWGTNLIARRNGAAPQFWLTAHYDSKSQWMSMALRLCGLVCFLVQVPALVALVAVWFGGERDQWIALLAVPALIGGALLARADLTNVSPGAVDNATGVLAAFETINRLPAGLPVGIAFFDAEEWGLQGARALVREQPAMLRGASVVNFDGLDDRGLTIVLSHRAGPLGPRIAQAAGARRAAWLPVLVDGMALARVTRECLTVMRGNWSTMRRVHTARDASDRLTLDGVRAVAAAVADAVQKA